MDCFFLKIFNNVIEVSEKSEVLQDRLKILYNEITLALYTNVSRGLFERHKLVFSLMLNMTIFLNDKIVSYAQWNFLLRGPGQFKTVIILIAFTKLYRFFNRNLNNEDFFYSLKNPTIQP